jgi:predicted signal transduction protein with EAL and GGDEF domain
MKRSIADGRCFRVSGDEYAVVLPGATLEQSFLTMEAFRAAVYGAQSEFRLPDGSGFDVSVTVGVAQFPRDGKDEPGLMNAADAALRAAKEAGRNQVALPPNEEMVMKSCYYPATMVRKLKQLSDKLKKKESILLREALGDVLRKYDRLDEG